MTRTHDFLVEVAEQIVRDKGLDALTTRSLAARANYGKSTVHEAVGGTDQLVKDLRRRASLDMLAAALGDTQPDPTDDVWRGAMFCRISEWIIANPHWAEVCFTVTGAAEHTQWTHPMADTLMGALPVGIADLDPEDTDEISALAARTIGGLVPTIIRIGDVDFGAHVLQMSFTSIHTTIAQVLLMRGLDTTPRAD